MTTRILLNYGHPHHEQSRLNRTLRDAVSSLPNVTVNDLTAHYPDFRIDVEREQQLLLNHEVIVLQFPLYWYSSPAIIKEWQDAVLTYGFAYGSQGNKLQGKRLMIATTSGAPVEAYQAGAFNQYTLSELLRPFQAMANLAGMHYQPIFSLGGALNMSEAVLDSAATAYRARLAGF